MQRSLDTEVDPATFREPLRIAGRVFLGIPAVRVIIRDGDWTGRGEGGGVFYLGDDVEHMLAQIESVRGDILAGADRQALQTLLPPGGARNALDAALWELEARQSGRAVWQLARLPRPESRVTTYTLSADEPGTFDRMLAQYSDAKAIKLKLNGDLPADALRLRQIRARRPDAWLMADANQGYDRRGLIELAPILAETGVRLLEQPIRRGSEAELDGLELPVPIAADESLLGIDELGALPGRFQVANIKLDKCGGLTEVLAMVAQARRLGLGVMVGNMGGTSLAAAPAFLLAQICDYVDLDGPKFLARDLPGGACYEDGEVRIDGNFWG